MGLDKNEYYRLWECENEAAWALVYGKVLLDVVVEQVVVDNKYDDGYSCGDVGHGVEDLANHIDVFWSEHDV